MAALHVVVGLVMLALGGFLILRRDSFPIRKRPATRAAAAPPTLWVSLGAMFIALGLLQLLLTFA